MKNIFLGVFALLTFAACSKTADGNTETKTVEAELVQKPLEFKNAAGEAISVTYYSEGDVVAAKIKPAGADEQKLIAKTVNHSGNPIFTNENFMWEIVNDGQSGKLSDKTGKSVEYHQSQQEN